MNHNNGDMIETHMIDFDVVNQEFDINTEHYVMYDIEFIHLRDLSHINIVTNIIMKNKAHLRQIIVNIPPHQGVKCGALYNAIAQCVNLEILHICGYATNDDFLCHINILPSRLHTINISNACMNATPILNNIVKYNNMIKCLSIDCNIVSIKAIEDIIINCHHINELKLFICNTVTGYWNCVVDAICNNWSLRHISIVHIGRTPCLSIKNIFDRKQNKTIIKYTKRNTQNYIKISSNLQQLCLNYLNEVSLEKIKHLDIKSFIVPHTT